MLQGVDQESCNYVLGLFGNQSFIDAIQLGFKPVTIKRRRQHDVGHIAHRPVTPFAHLIKISHWAQGLDRHEDLQPAFLNY